MNYTFELRGDTPFIGGLEMASHVVSAQISGLKNSLINDYRRVGLMGLAAVVLSAATIIYYNHKMYAELIANTYNVIGLAAITLMPYMISAVIATITTIGITSMLPMVKSEQAARKIHQRVKELAEGDLTTHSRLDCSNAHLKDIAGELNYAIGFMGSSVAQWKIINRQQWDLLEAVRRATLKENHIQALKLIDKMEENWRMTAQIEDRFKT